MIPKWMGLMESPESLTFYVCDRKEKKKGGSGLKCSSMT